MKRSTPTKAARLWGIRTYGAYYWVDDPDNRCRALERAYIAGLRRGQRQNRSKRA